MDITIYPKKLSGPLTAIPSKSQAHRLLICAAFADGPTELVCPQTNRDIDATADCLRALGADIQRTIKGFAVIPVRELPRQAELNCRESGSTLRFLLPVAGALGVDTLFRLEGRLPQRPLSPLWEEMERMGCCLSRPTADTIRCRGKLRSGEYTIDGSVSSQFITGFLLAFALIGGQSRLHLTGRVESRPYIDMTCQAMESFHVSTADLTVNGRFQTPGKLTVEGDWSNGSFFLAANSLGNTIALENLSSDSTQGDKAVSRLLPELDGHVTVSAADIPDLIPILSVVAAAKHGAVFTNAGRLRLKESDRIESTMAMLKALGGQAQATEDTLTVIGTGLTGGTVDSVNDHRIAMSAAIAATACSRPVTILGAQCVEKSYPHFWEEYRRLGGHYEQHLR